jgi:hypothetical protein
MQAVSGRLAAVGKKSRCSLAAKIGNVADTGFASVVYGVFVT